jgi:predicted MPP superfamily phosphohydrolase
MPPVISLMHINPKMYYNENDIIERSYIVMTFERDELMKKIIGSLLLGMATLSLVACQSSGISYYTDDTPLTLSLTDNQLRIMQITDLHLTYGIDYHDRHTLRLIDEMAAFSDPDLIVITGDIAMSPMGPSLFKLLYNRLEKLGIPWTFVFGNHETDFKDYERYLAKIGDAKHLLFKVGPEMTDGGYGNFIIETTYAGSPFYNLYLMDSRTENENTISGYDYMSLQQVAWYRNHAAVDQVAGTDSLAFMHMPLIQYEDYVDYTLVDGAMEEGIICYQGVDTSFFDSMVDFGVTKGVFVGHDHNNNFSFYDEGILLAYGQTTGFNGYGFLERGARIIDIDASKTLNSYLLLESEMSL